MKLLNQDFSQQFWEKAPCQNWEKMIDLTSKLGEINNIGHNKGTKIYPQNQVILDCIMPSIPLKHKCLSIIQIWVIVSHKKKLSLKKRSCFFFTFLTFLNWEKQTWYWGKKVTIFDWEWGRKFGP